MNADMKPGHWRDRASDGTIGITPQKESAGPGHFRLAKIAGLPKVADKTVYTIAQRGELPAFKVRG